MTLAGLVSARYPSPEWAVFFEVSDATGFRGRRRADAVALGIWPSRGYTLIGFEFKEDRRDWMREKENPAKADVIAGHCDVFYVVAGRDGIVRVEELPEPWGLLVANEDRTKLKAAKAAQPFPDREKSTMRRSFAASMLRKVTETTVPRVELERLVQERVDQAVARTREGHQVKHLEREVERLTQCLDTFKTITGVDLRHGWRGTERLAEAVEAVLSMGSQRQALQDAQRRLETAALEIAGALAQWPQHNRTAAAEARV